MVYKNVGIKISSNMKKKEAFCKQRIEKNISIPRKYLSRIDDWLKGRWKNGGAKLEGELKKKYKLKETDFSTAIEELKQRILAKTLKFRRCNSEQNF